MSGPAVKGTARLLVSAGSAKPSPKIGQALGPLGVNMAEFCKRFNEQTLSLRPSAVMRVRLTAFEDRSFAFDVRARTPRRAHRPPHTRPRAHTVCLRRCCRRRRRGS
jgi:ribosomal protein L11